jgi:hypothetical protein
MILHALATLSALPQHATVTAIDLDAFRHRQIATQMTNPVIYGPHYYWYSDGLGGTTLKVKELPPSEYLIARGGVVDMSNLITRASLALQVDATGSALDVGGGRAIVTGVGYGQGNSVTGVIHVVQYRYVSGTHVLDLLDSESYSFDPVWTAVVPPLREHPYFGGALVVYDHTTRRLLGAQWGPTSNSLPADSAFAVIADSSSIPALQHGDLGCFIDEASIVVTDEEGMSGMWRITPPALFPGTWTVSPIGFTQPDDGMGIRSVVTASGLEGLQLYGPGSYQIETEAGVVVHTGSAPSGWASTGPISVLDSRPGLMHVVTRASDGAGIARFRPMLRRGSPLTAAGGSLARGRVRENYLVPGGHGVVGVPLTSVATTGTARFALAMGLYSPSQANLVQFGGHAALRWSALRSFSTDIGEIRHAIGIDIVMPNNEALNGLQPIFQWWMRFPDGTLAHSDVFGTSVVGNGTGVSPPTSFQVDLLGVNCLFSASPNSLVVNASYAQISAAVQEILSN